MIRFRAHALTAWFIVPVAVLGPAITCVAPRAMAPLFMGFGLLSMIAHILRVRRLPRLDPPLSILFGGALLWGALSWFWSLSPDDTIGKLGQLTAIFAVLAFWKREVAQFERSDLQLIGRSVFAGLIGGLTLYAFDWAGSGHFAIYDLVRGGFSEDLPDVRQNKPIVLLALWASFAFPYIWLSDHRNLKIFYTVMAAAIAVATFYSPSDSALLTIGVMALVTGLTVFFKNPRILTVIITAGMIVLAFAMLPAARIVGSQTEWLQNRVLPRSIEARVEIWDQAARRIMEKPVAGWGLDSSPYLPNRDEHMASTPWLTISHLHPHNAPLQIWFELGLVGMAFLSALLIVTGRGVARISDRFAHCYALVAFTQTYLYTLSIWGIWQTWFTATLLFAGVMTYAGVRHITLNKTAA